jgi:hypothetical protein
VDNHPLVNPVANFEIPNFNTPITSPTVTPPHSTNDVGLTPDVTPHETAQNVPSTFHRKVLIIIGLLTILAVLSGTFLILKKKTRCM